MLMALGLFLTFAQRYMTRKRKSDIRTEVKAVITKALSGGDTSRVITEGNAEGSSTSQRQAGGGAAVEGEQARGGLEGTMTIHASNLGESVYTYTLVAEETTSRKRPRAGATLLTSASAESARALVNTSSGERGRKRPRTSKIGLKPYLEEMIFPTDLSDDNEDERDQLFDALVKEYPYQYRAGTDVEDLHQYHLQILWDRTLLLRIAYLVR
ncbi:hypothetical protein B0H15DRAFT_150600 [Mycena belliarum]|uniref:Uncharacterized protein n=1 Tax=Mycena belliarum TaxID=1033014 RepID=A0AAD6UB24_9AGAR|nr:hypothetical protein B0H15DRAFT_150600 [Mycena belliae]